MTKTLFTGGVRSGKSRHAEALLADRRHVTYVAPGPVPDPETDPDWADRVARHRAQRPDGWVTVETTDVAAGVRAAPGAVLLDCLGTWLTAVLDETGWESDRDVLEKAVEGRLAALVRAIDGHRDDVVVVTNEVGLSVVPEHRSGRVFRDLLGVVNQRVAEVCDDVVLVVAGRLLRL